MNSELKDKNATQWFNLALGMAQYCSNLADFHILLDARRDACYDEDGNKQPALDKFIVKGKWVLDEYGQIGTLMDICDERDYSVIAKDRLPEFPLVLHIDDFKKLIEDHLRPKITWKFGFDGSPTPLSFPPRTQCKICQKEITLDESSQVLFSEREDFSREEAIAIIGDISSLTIEEIQGKLINHHHAAIRLSTSQQGKLTVENFEYYMVQYLAHESCHCEEQSKRIRSKFHEAFINAGVDVFGSIRSKNEYGSESYHGPWFKFDTSLGIITVGWRRHVINVNYSDIDPNYKPYTIKTSGLGFEHVDNYEDLIDAIERFKTHLDEKK